MMSSMANATNGNANFHITFLPIVNGKAQFGALACDSAPVQ
jgi:hypothetical protein